MKKITLIFSIIIFIGACKKDKSQDFYDIYIAGYTWLPDTIINGIAISSTDVATVWKNDSIMLLSDTSSYANAIFLKDDNVYVAGSIFPDGATYWINGIRHRLPSYRLPRTANDITAFSNNVYVCGYVGHYSDSSFVAKLWRNGIDETLANSADAISNAVAVASNGDVYVVGWKKIGNIINAVYWKNGQQFILGTGVANDIFIDESTIYIGGHIYNNIGVPRAAYWKNNLVTILDNDNNSDIVAISVTDNAVFAAGRTNSDACYWRNGVEFQVQTNGNDNNYINDMATHGNTAYSVGSILTTANQKAYYWNNRSKIRLPYGSYDNWSEANAIAIKEK